MNVQPFLQSCSDKIAQPTPFHHYTITHVHTYIRTFVKSILAVGNAVTVSIPRSQSGRSRECLLSPLPRYTLCTSPTGASDEIRVPRLLRGSISHLATPLHVTYRYYNVHTIPYDTSRGRWSIVESVVVVLSAVLRLPLRDQLVPVIANASLYICEPLRREMGLLGSVSPLRPIPKVSWQVRTLYML